ncbi:hypothetical protein BV25DRAFT_1834202 [Artomyces pyxidatus]|uniref:Uncharacterized protein n=1 Tax=Artomyces pyxidatus TaxID=48021 RepID=A0ACB8TLB1_9AGAM|nr:hypothetical protein BV25DRAFT_1834202 [Artomyces pyxidatus]
MATMYWPAFEGHSRDVVLVGTVALLYAVVVLARCYRRQSRVVPVVSARDDGDRSRSAVLSIDEKDPNKDRTHGEWTPVDFTYPSITPLQENLEDMPVRPYRPFRAGTYHITMGIRNMEFDNWIEPDHQFPAFHRLRAHRVATQKHKLIQVLPDRPGLVKGGADAASELMYELAEFLSRRCPKVYRVSRHPSSDKLALGWYGEGRIKDITILPLNITYHLDQEDPMTVCALLIQDDLAIMIEGSDGRYYLQAGAILLPGSWRLRDKIGMPLDEIHISGHVPHYEQKLQPSLTRFFRRLTPSGPVARDNWLIWTLDPTKIAEETKADAAGRVGDPDALAWSETAYGPEDEFFHPPSSYALSLGASAPPPPVARPAAPTPTPAPTPQTMRLRAEHQTLRRLPRSGAIVFTIRTYLTPIEELGRESGIPGRLASAVRGVQGVVWSHRKQVKYEQALLDYLDKCHREQVEAGAVDGDASETTK